MRKSKRFKTLSRSVIVVALTLSTNVAQAQQKQKSNVQRERCAQVATRAVSTPGSAFYVAPVRGGGHISGGGIAGLIIGAVVVGAIAASVANSARAEAENKCLAAAGLRPNSEPAVTSTGDKPKRSASAPSGNATRTSARDAVGSGGGQSGWIRRSIRSQQ